MAELEDPKSIRERAKLFEHIYYGSPQPTEGPRQTRTINRRPKTLPKPSNSDKPSNVGVVTPISYDGEPPAVAIPATHTHINDPQLPQGSNEDHEEFRTSDSTDGSDYSDWTDCLVPVYDNESGPNDDYEFFYKSDVNKLTKEITEKLEDLVEKSKDDDKPKMDTGNSPDLFEIHEFVLTELKELKSWENTSWVATLLLRNFREIRSAYLAYIEAISREIGPFKLKQKHYQKVEHQLRPLKYISWLGRILAKYLSGMTKSMSSAGIFDKEEEQQEKTLKALVKQIIELHNDIEKCSFIKRLYGQEFQEYASLIGFLNYAPPNSKRRIELNPLSNSNSGDKTDRDPSYNVFVIREPTETGISKERRSVFKFTDCFVIASPIDHVEKAYVCIHFRMLKDISHVHRYKEECNEVIIYLKKSSLNTNIALQGDTQVLNKIVEGSEDSNVRIEAPSDDHADDSVSKKSRLKSMFLPGGRAQNRPSEIKRFGSRISLAVMESDSGGDLSERTRFGTKRHSTRSLQCVTEQPPAIPTPNQLFPIQNDYLQPSTTEDLLRFNKKANEDSRSNMCAICQSTMTGKRKQMTCKGCGKAVCITCCPNRMYLPSYGFKAYKVCPKCFDHTMTHLPHLKCSDNKREETAQKESVINQHLEAVSLKP